ncbi:MAG: hypothetical protein GXP23_09500 [Gammaproteobacteria bacterium]|nr:hypothetical protein [Gammaproteobacteria bacterium]
MRKVFMVLVAGALLGILSACNSSTEVETTSSGGGAVATAVTLGAFKDFSCTSNWTNRDGALGLKAYSGSGTCQAKFPGVSGKYRLTLTVQTEFDGRPPYSVSINGVVVKSGTYPVSSSLGCSCPKDWRSVCPDIDVDFDAGIHQVNTGDVIQFYGKEQFACSGNGAYAKWHRIVFIPVP